MLKIDPNGLRGEENYRRWLSSMPEYTNEALTSRAAIRSLQDFSGGDLALNSDSQELLRILLLVLRSTLTASVASAAPSIRLAEISASLVKPLAAFERHKGTTTADVVQFAAIVASKQIFPKSFPQIVYSVYGQAGVGEEAFNADARAIEEGLCPIDLSAQRLWHGIDRYPQRRPNVGRILGGANLDRPVEARAIGTFWGRSAVAVVTFARRLGALGWIARRRRQG